ncbi:hypothetical protein EJ06DRAFT_381340 [Trichodelitschia bisporula]|uniref:Uncharacterized protein n=1 Tax=Trichodelitschia bisporula TaxID=703511 RepID=A0A6G1HZA1_9PEZI|nr:hypothetical protein EJ06DRAFT_381340 [Trichodelitschia bisporula]
MVKVLENKVVDLDLLPGTSEIEARRQFRELRKNAAGQVELEGDESKHADAQDGESNPQQMQIPREMLPDNMSAEQKDRARGVAGTILDGSGKVIGGLAGTVGGVLKGVGDTAGNTVYALGSGLGKTGVDATTGLVNTAKAPLGDGAAPVEHQAPLDDGATPVEHQSSTEK